MSSEVEILCRAFGLILTPITCIRYRSQDHSHYTVALKMDEGEDISAGDARRVINNLQMDVYKLKKNPDL